MATAARRRGHKLSDALVARAGPMRPRAASAWSALSSEPG